MANRKAHGAGVTCVAPSPHDPWCVATGSYDVPGRLGIPGEDHATVVHRHPGRPDHPL